MKAQATPIILKTVCETIAGNIGLWNLALDFSRLDLKVLYQEDQQDLVKFINMSNLCE